MRADIKSEVPRAKKAAIEAIQGRRPAWRVIGAEAPAYGFAFHVKISAAPAAYSGGTIIPSGASRVGMPARMRRAEAPPSAVRTIIPAMQGEAGGVTPGSTEASAHARRESTEIRTLRPVCPSESDIVQGYRVELTHHRHRVRGV